MGLLTVFDPLCQDYFQHHDLEGKPRSIPKFKDDARCSLPGSTQKLLFILIYMKENRATVARISIIRGNSSVCNSPV